jgi:hypothetical protein
MKRKGQGLRDGLREKPREMLGKGRSLKGFSEEEVGLLGRFP